MVHRRGLLRSVGVGVAGLSVLGAADASNGQDDAQASVTFRDQTTDGQEVVIASVSTSVEVMYSLRARDGDKSFARGRFEAGTDREDVTIPLSPPLQQDTDLSFGLYPTGGGSSLAYDTAEVTVSGAITYLDGLSVTRVDADPDAGFHYPYFLYAPTVAEAEAGGPMLVEPNNTGTATDDFEQHEERARQVADHGLSRDISDQLGVPLLVPVFPRPKSDPVDWRHYVHQLDRDTMQISDGPLERVDLQLLRMVEHAQQKLADMSYPVADDIIMNGFSASGNFVDRFTVLHPDRVVSVTAGGLNGMALLPLEEAKGHTLNFHVGIADVEDLTGEPVDLDALDDVNQFLYMGGEDANDTIPYTDAWTSDELRETALAVYGEDMLNDRFPYCQSAYEEAGVEAQFRVYEGVGHTPRPAKEDIVEFHRRSIEGEDVSSFGQRLGLHPSVERRPTNPAVSEPVEFDATGSTLARGDILAYTWDFGDGETAVGETVSHAFDESGEYTVTLRVIDSNGRAAETQVELAVEESPSEAGDGEQETTADGEQGTTTASDEQGTTTDDERGTTTGDEEETTTTDETDSTAREGTASGTTASAGSEDATGTEADESSASTEDATSGDAASDDAASGGVPGFGIGTALTSLGGAAYLLDRRLRNDRDG